MPDNDSNSQSPIESDSPITSPYQVDSESPISSPSQIDDSLPPSPWIPNDGNFYLINDGINEPYWLTVIGPRELNPQQAADPVNLYNGNFVYSSTDFQIEGAGFDFDFTRSYSQLSFYNGPLGFNWDHNYNLWLRVSDDNLLIHCSSGTLRLDLYRKHEILDYWIPPDGESGILLEQSDSFAINMPDGSKIIYQPHPTLHPKIHIVNRIEDRFGNYLHFFYSDGLLQKIEINQIDRIVYFFHDTLNRIISIQDFTGRNWKYNYDDLGDLVAVTTPSTTIHKKGLTTWYEYSTAMVSDPCGQHNLTTIIDADGQIYLENKYGIEKNLLSYNRVVSQRQGNGDILFDYMDVIKSFDFPYQSNEKPTHQTIVTERDGGQVRYLFNQFGNMIFKEEYARINGIPKLVSSHYRFNKDGNLIGEISPLGIITQYLYGRDYYEKKFPQDYDYNYYTDANLTQKVRQGFHTLLSAVNRKSYYSINSLNISSGLWSSDIFPDIYITNDEDIIQKFNYENEFFQLITSSDLRFTVSTNPDFIEPEIYHLHLTKFRFIPGNGFQNFYLNSVELPRPTLPDGNTSAPIITTFTEYDLKGKLLKIVSPNGLETTITYFSNSEGILEGFLKSTEVDPEGFSIKAGMDRDFLGRVTKVYSPKYYEFLDNRFFSTSEFNELNQVVRTVCTAPFSINTLRTYNRTGNLSKTSIELKDSGNIKTGIFESFNKYNEEFHLTSQVSGNIKTGQIKQSKFIYDRSGRPYISIAPSGYKSKVKYNERGLNWQTIADFGSLNAITINYFDADGRFIRSIDPLGNITRFKYDALGRPIELEDAKGNKLISRFDKAGNLVVELFYEKFSDLEYRLLTRKESNYDEIGRIITSGVNKFEISPIISVNQLQSSFITEGPGELLITNFFFNNVNNLYKIIDPSGKIFALEYDSLSRVIKKTDPNGNEIIYQYDKENNVLRTDRKEVTRDKISDEIIRTRYFAESSSYDEVDRLIERINSLGSKVKLNYDSRNNIVTAIDPLNNVVEYQYDIFSKLVQNTKYLHQYRDDDEPDPITLSYTYNRFDLVTHQKDALERITQFTYDSSGRQICSILPDGSTDFINYNRIGNISSYIDRNGLKKSFKYDELNRGTDLQIDTSGLFDGIEVGGAMNFKTEYDGIGRITRMQNDTVITEFSYNSLGWNQEEINSFELIGGIGLPITLSTKREFNNTGAQIGLTYPSGRKIEYDRDILERIIAIRQVQKGNSYPGDNLKPEIYTIAEIEYEGLLRSKINRSNHTSTEYKYDFGSRLIEIRHSSNENAFLQLQFIYDALGNMLQQIEVADEYQKKQRYYYDSLSRIIAVQDSDTVTESDMTAFAPSQLPIPAIIPDYQMQLNAFLLSDPLPEKRSYNYDKVGNRVNSVINGSTNSYLTNQLDQYEDINEIAYHYNKNGNLKEDFQFLYTYNHINQLARFRNIADGSETFFLYDSLGRRCAKLKEGELSTMVYDGHNLLEEYENGILKSSILSDMGQDNLIFNSKNNEDLYFYSDLTKSVRFLFTGSEKFNFYQYDEFGNISNSLILNDSNQFRFGGKRFLSQLNKYDFVFRIYDPNIGKFIQRDPKGFVDGTNLYCFVENNPLSSTDPFGTESRPEVNLRSSLDAISAVNTPVDKTGKPLKGSYNLWSGKLGHAEAVNNIKTTGGGWLIDNTPEFSEAQAAQSNYQRNRPGQIPDKYYDNMWGKPSRSLARRAVLARMPIESFGLDTHSTPHTTIQYQHEIPTVLKTGIVSGGLMKGGGLLDIYSALQINNNYVKGVGLTGGTVQIFGGSLYTGGAVLMNSKMMKAGSFLGRFSGGPTTAILSGYGLYQDIKNGDVASGIGNGAGVFTGAAITVGSTTGVVVFGTFAVSYTGGRWVRQETGWGNASAEVGGTVANFIMGEDPGTIRTGIGYTAGFVVTAGGTILVEPTVWAGKKIGQGLNFIDESIMPEGRTLNPITGVKSILRGVNPFW